MNTKLSWMRMRLFALVGVMTAMMMNGCASPDIAGLVAKNARTPFYVVTIHFENGCPKSVTPPPPNDCREGTDPPAHGFCARPGKSVQWVSDPDEPLAAFEVYFDPFVDRPYKSQPPHEQTRPVVIRVGSMEGVYKYSVLGVTCEGEPEDAVLDPPILVER